MKAEDNAEVIGSVDRRRMSLASCPPACCFRDFAPAQFDGPGSLVNAPIGAAWRSFKTIATCPRLSTR